MNQLIGEMFLVAAVAVSLSRMDDHIAGCIADTIVCVGGAIGSITYNAARVAVNAAWKTVRDQHASTGEIARKVAADELVRYLEQNDPVLVAALKTAGFVQCIREYKNENPPQPSVHSHVTFSFSPPSGLPPNSGLLLAAGLDRRDLVELAVQR